MDGYGNDQYLAALLGDAYDELGVRAMRGGGRAAAIVRDQRAVRAQQVAQQITTPMPGVPGVEPAMLPLGFTPVQFTNTSALTLTSTSTPQKPLKGMRVVIDLARTAAATQLVTITRFLVGATNILPSADPVGVAFAAGGAFHTVLALPPAGPGIIITIDYRVSAQPGVGETIDISTVFIGPTVAG